MRIQSLPTRSNQELRMQNWSDDLSFCIKTHSALNQFLVYLYHFFKFY